MVQRRGQQQVPAEVVIGTSRTVTVVASEMTTVGIDFMRLDSAVEFEVRCPQRHCSLQALPLKPPHYSLQS